MRLVLVLALTCALLGFAGSAWSDMLWFDLYETGGPAPDVGPPVNLGFPHGVAEGYVVVLEDPLMPGQDWLNNRSLWSDVLQFYNDQGAFAQLISDPAWQYLRPNLSAWTYVVEDAGGYAEYVIPGVVGYRIHSDGDIPEAGSAALGLLGLVPVAGYVRLRKR